MLSILLNKAVPKEHIKGVLGHVQYADDIVLMIDGSYSYEPLLDRKVILYCFVYCFEWMSGLKINFHISEVPVFGVPREEKGLDSQYAELRTVLFTH